MIFVRYFRCYRRFVDWNRSDLHVLQKLLSSVGFSGLPQALRNDFTTDDGIRE